MTPEQHADSVLILLDSDFGQSGRDIRWLAIRDQIRQADRTDLPMGPRGEWRDVEIEEEK